MNHALFGDPGLHFKKMFVERINQGFPGGSRVKNQPASAGGSFDPRSGKIPHVVGHLRPRTTATEPAPWGPGATATEAHALQPVPCSERSHRNAKPSHCN